MKFKASNWPEYEAGLRRRGSLTLWISSEALSCWPTPMPAQELRPDRLCLGRGDLYVQELAPTVGINADGDDGRHGDAAAAAAGS